MLHETAAVSAQILCIPYNHAPCHFMQSRIRKVFACLAVTCHLHFGQNDQDLLCATAVTLGWNGYRNKSTKSKPWRRQFSHRSCRNSNPRPFNHESGALTAELSPPRWCISWSPFLRMLHVLTWPVFINYLVLNLFCSKCSKKDLKKFSVPANSKYNVRWQIVAIVFNSASKKCAYWLVYLV